MKYIRHNPASISQIQKISEAPFFDHHAEQEQPFSILNKVEEKLRIR